ncbi:MAG: F0F1 ATP synthase subunit A [Clostridiales bacterium]|nr:F0F1 ATP synthase subunit A [Clostridiales bacterium]
MEGGFGPIVAFEIFGIPITQTVTTTWFIMAIVILLSYLATRKFEKNPKNAQNMAEIVVDTINGLTRQTMGEANIGFAPYIGTLIIFIALSNIAGLFGLRPPTADVNTTMGLAIMTFLMIHFFGAKSKGVLPYMKGFLEPFAALLPLNIMGELATPISLGFRLFGNIIGGVIIMNLLYGALAGLTTKLIGINIPILQVGIPALLHVYFDLFAGILQSFIFTMLTMVFVSIAIE